MAKPCNGFLYPDDPHTSYRPGCVICELAATRAEYAAQWGEPPPKVSLPPRKIGVANTPLPPCPKLGDPTGQTELCQTCSGRVELKVFNCAVFGTCTIKKKVDGHGCCEGCQHRPKA